MSKCRISIWGRDFELDVIYECYHEEDVLESQREAFAMFEHNANEIADSLESVKNYIYKNDTEKLAEDTIENIFKYVMPKSIFVPHTKNHRSVAIMCNYKFDMEHGIAVVFENGAFKNVGEQDIIL